MDARLRTRFEVEVISELLGELSHYQLLGLKSECAQDEIDVGEDGETMDSATYARTVQLLILKNSQGPSPARVLARWDGETTHVS